MKVSDLKPNPKNPRTISPEKLSMLKNALMEFGDLSGIVFNRKTSQLVGGHQRKQILDEANIIIEKKYAKPTVTGTVAEGFAFWNGERFTYREVSWSKSKEMAANLAANKNAGQWDMPVVGEFLKELSSFDVNFDINLTMFDKDEINSFGGITVSEHTRTGATGVDEDEVPEKAPARTKLGDIYELGRHRLMCGDSTDVKTVEKLMNGEKADMVFTDPPYGVNYDGGHANEQRREKLANDNSTLIYDGSVPNMFAFSKPNAALYLWFAATKSLQVLQVLQVNKYEIRSWLIWNKNVAQFGAIGAQYKQKHEPCLYAYKKGTAPFWGGPTNEVSVWDVSRAHKNEFHPTQKPVELSKRAIENSCPPDGAVLDLFGGSGATLIGAEATGRNGYVMELDPGYCDVIVERWEKYTGNKAKLITQKTKLKKLHYRMLAGIMSKPKKGLPKGAEPFKFKKGVSGNPLGGKLHNPAIKALSKITVESFREVIELVLTGNLTELKAMAEHPKTSALQVGIIMSFQKAMKNGDYAVIERICERLVGKIPDELNVNSKNLNANIHTEVDKEVLKAALLKLESEI